MRKYLIFNKCDSDSDKSDESHKESNSIIPEEFSIDNLLKTRQKESASNTPILVREKPKSNKNLDILSDLLSSSSSVQSSRCHSQKVLKSSDSERNSQNFEKDGNIFQFTQQVKPLQVFDFIEKNDRENIDISIQKLDDWQMHALLLMPQFVDPNEKTLFSLIREMIDQQSSTLGESIYQYLKKFGDNSITYSWWYQMVKETADSYIVGMIYLLSIDDYTKFAFSSTDEKSQVPSELILLHLSAILCKDIAEHLKFHYCLDALRSLLKQFEHLICNDNFVDLYTNCYLFSIECGVDTTALLISFFPLDGLGCELMYQVMMRLTLVYMRISNIPEEISLDFLSESMVSLKRMCESMNKDDPLYVSACVTLIEKIVVIAIKKKRVTTETLGQISKRFKFSINSSNPGDMTELKEQIHVTRTQLDALIQSYFL